MALTNMDPGGGEGVLKDGHQMWEFIFHGTCQLSRKFQDPLLGPHQYDSLTVLQ